MVGHYRAAVGALLVFDLTDRETFECLDHWLTELRENCSEFCQIALVANKVDLVNEDPNKREVSIEEIRKFAEYNNLRFIGETSAKEDINIKETFETLLQAVHMEQRELNEQKKIDAMRIGSKTIYDDSVNKGSCCY